MKHTEFTDAQPVCRIGVLSRLEQARIDAACALNLMNDARLSAFTSQYVPPLVRAGRIRTYRHGRAQLERAKAIIAQETGQ